MKKAITLLALITLFFGNIQAQFCIPSAVSFNITACGSYTVPSGDETYTAMGTYPVMDTLLNAGGCDSVMTITLTMLPALTGSVTTTLCNEDSVIVNGVTYNVANPTGTEIFTNIGPNNCDSTVTINLNMLPALTGSVTDTICYQDSVVVNGTTYNAINLGGTEVFPNMGPNNCDSVVIIDLTILLDKTGGVTNTICNDDSIVVNGTTYNLGNPTGTEIFSNIGPNNCDSTVTIALNVLPVLTGSVTDTICNEGNRIVNGTIYDAMNPTGTELFTNAGAFGCDSTVTVNLTVLPALASVLNLDLCTGDSIIINGTTYNTPVAGAVEVFTNVGPYNCDSTVTININVVPILTGVINQSICYGQVLVVNGNTYDTTVVGATEIFTNIGPGGCDSIVTINLTVAGPIDNTVTNNSPTLMANQANVTYQWLDCDNGNAPINGETNQSFTSPVNGRFAVTLTVGACIYVSSCEIVFNVVVNENSFGNDLNIYPNPAKESVTIDFGISTTLKNQAVQISIINIAGQEVYSQENVNEAQTVISLSHLSKGVYFVKVRSNQQQQVMKLTRQ